MKNPSFSIHRFFLTMVLAASSFALPGAAGAADAVSMTFQSWDGYYRIESTFFVAADPSVAWQVLTDYDHITRFVSSMKESKVLKRDPSDLFLEQQAEGGFLFFTKRARLLLFVQETPGQLITFQDMDHKDFDIYWGNWALVPKDGGVEVSYNLLANPNFSAPLAGDIMSGSSRDMIEAIRREMLKRQAVQSQLAASFTPTPEVSATPVPQTE